MFENFKPTPKTIENLSELANKVYDDGLKKPVQSTGEVIAILPQAIKAALEPVEQWILYKKYNLAITEKILEEKLQDTSPEEIVAPEPYVAVPALNAITYCFDSDELRNLYANLLARSMLAPEKDNVHPSFVEIIKQMSPADAKILKVIYETNSKPLIHLRWTINNSSSQLDVMNNLSWIEDFGFKEASISIENLSRLKLIDIPPHTYYPDKKIYDKILDSPKFKEFLDTLVLVDYPGGKYDFVKGKISRNAFGKLFYDICIKDL